MQIQAKTSLALKEKIKAPSTRKQMFDVLKGKRFIQEISSKSFQEIREMAEISFWWTIKVHRPNC
jgi:hypothetical protein